MVTLEEQMQRLDQQLRVWSMPAHVARAIEEGERAKADHEAKKAALLKEKAELAEAMAQQVSASEYLKRKAEREAHEAAIAKAEAALREAAEEYVATYGNLVAHLKAAADGVSRAMAQMRVIGQLSQALAPGGRVPIACNDAQLESDMALLVCAAFRGIPGHKNRLGHLVWLSGADLRYPAGADWAAAEQTRVERLIVAPLVKAEG